MAENEKFRLLAITDVKTIRELEQILSLEANIEMVEATTSRLEGVQRAAELQPDVILLDYFLPLYSSDEMFVILPGWKVKPWRNDFINICKQLVQKSPYSKIIVLLSISRPGSDFKQLGKAGIIKDFSPKLGLRDELLRSIDYVCHQSHIFIEASN